MLLKDFSGQFGGLGDEFLFHFKRPFLVEEGSLQFDDDDDDGGARHLFYLTGDGPEPLVVGRSSRAHVTIKITNVSSRHLELIPPPQRGGRWHVRDLGSTNGTFLNGEKLGAGPRPLGDEALLGLGPLTTFLFLEPVTFLQWIRRRGQAKPAPVSLTEETSAGLPRVALPDVSDSDAAPVVGPRLFLRCDPFDPLALEVGQTVVVGRSDVHADLVLPHPQVSRRNTEIQRRPEGVFVRDLHSSNGTLVGETQVGSQFLELLPGKSIRLADFEIVVEGYPQDSAVFGQTVAVAPPRPRTFSCGLEKVDMESLLLSVEEAQKTGLVEVNSERLSGRITFRAGKPCEAWADGGLEGAAAIRALLRAGRSGTFTLIPDPSRVGARKIQVPFSDLCLEAFLTE